MRIVTFRAETAGAAMARVRDELGPDALILSTRPLEDEVEIRASAARMEAGTNQAPLEPAKAETGAAPHPYIRARTPFAQRTRPWRPKPLNPDLAWHGVPPGIAARLAGPDLQEALTAHFCFGPLPNDARAAIMLVGPPGAGKTLTIAKLATRLVMTGQRPMIVCADGRRAAAAEELAAYARVLGAELAIASRPSALVRALASPHDGPTLIDTAGLAPFEAEAMQELVQIGLEANVVPVAVVAAGSDPGEAAEQAAAFAAAGVAHILPTRLDAARRLGGVLAAASAGSLVLTEAGTGFGIADGLTPLTPAFLARRLSVKAQTRQEPVSDAS